MGKLIVFFYIDAFDFRMVSNKFTPFLFNIASKKYYKELENIVGYSFAIQSCMLSGKYPDNNLHWMPYFYSPQNSPILFKILGIFRKIIPLDKFSYARYGLLNISRKLFMRKGVHANNIYLSVINNISLFPYYYMNELSSFLELKKTLKEKYQTKMIYIGPPKVKANIYSYLLRHIKEFTSKKNRVIIIYEDTLDGIGHNFGPSSSEYINRVQELDKLLAYVYSKILKIDENSTFLFFSDHAQSKLTNSIDIISILNKNGLKMPNDYLCFIDATMILFWPNENTIREKIISILMSLKVGTLLDDRLREKYHLKFEDRMMYGDLIYILKPGYTFFPNFYSPIKPMKGLHGYFPEDEAQKSFLISNRNILTNITHVKDIRNLLTYLSS